MELMRWLQEELQKVEVGNLRPKKKIRRDERVLGVLPKHLRAFFIFYMRFMKRSDARLQRLVRRIALMEEGPDYMRLMIKYSLLEHRMWFVEATFWAEMAIALPETACYNLLAVRRGWRVTTQEPVPC